MVFAGLIGCGPSYLHQSQKQRSWNKEKKKKKQFQQKGNEVLKCRESIVKSLSQGKDLQVLRGQRSIGNQVLLYQDRVEKVIVNTEDYAEHRVP